MNEGNRQITHTAIDDFTPQYDADGNQTLIKTETGVWSVTYNAENRPIRWQSGDTVITMAFDRMGRRIEMRTQSADSDTLQRFVYDNYLCVQQLRTPSNALFHSYVWDPTEPIATRPLIFLPSSGVLSYYFHDGNKNVSDLVSLSGVAVHYDYTPFGAPTSSVLSGNPYTFSSEVYDNTLGLIYYNYRHYNFDFGRWCTREPLEEMESFGVYGFVCNSPIGNVDIHGERIDMTYVVDGKEYTRSLESFTITDLLCILECIKNANGMITVLDFVGHGNPEQIIINDIFEKPKFFGIPLPKSLFGGVTPKEGTLSLDASDGRVTVREATITDQGSVSFDDDGIHDVTDILTSITDSQTTISLIGCKTASHSDFGENLTQSVSRALPHTAVKGYPSKIIMPAWNDVPMRGRIVPFGIFPPKTYRNGREK